MVSDPMMSILDYIDEHTVYLKHKKVKPFMINYIQKSSLLLTEYYDGGINNHSKTIEMLLR